HSKNLPERRSFFFYWLNVVELLSGDSPVVIVKNEKQDRRREINDSQLRGRFQNLKETLAVNLADNRGLDDLVGLINHYISSLPHGGTKLPKTWVKVRTWPMAGDASRRLSSSARR